MKNNSDALTHAKDLLYFIDESPSPWHAVDSAKKRLSQNNFQELDESEPWALEQGTGYFVVRGGSSIIAFFVGEKNLVETGYKIIGAHTDSPGLRVKPNPLISFENIDRIGVEIYGSPILATFTDRDLSLAGQVTVIDNGSLNTRLFKVEKPILRLPNLAIHMNRKVNEEGLRLHLQNELPLLLSSSGEALNQRNPFLDFLGEQLQVNVEAVSGWDLAVFDTHKGEFFGLNDEFIADSQLDNLASCHAALTALLSQKSEHSDTTKVCAFFDHEEIGSESSKGADGNFLPDVLERIALSLNLSVEAYKRTLAQSFLISADMAHAYQPNFASAYEPGHPVFVNRGPVIKINANQHYSSDNISEAHFVQLCSEVEIAWQKYSHRSNLPCGSTIGPMTSARLGIQSVDVGCPMWAMHSIRESAGVQDHNDMTRVMTHFFSRDG